MSSGIIQIGQCGNQIGFNIFNNLIENDKNNSNYCYNKKNYFDNKKKYFKYQKKLSKNEIITNSDFSEENENDFGNSNLNKNGGKEESKDEKNNSIEYTATTAYSHSNSSSAHLSHTISNFFNCHSCNIGRFCILSC